MTSSAQPDRTGAREAPAHAAFVAVPPPEDLAPVVEYLYRLDLPAPRAPESFFRVVPDGYLDLSVSRGRRAGDDARAARHDPELDRGPMVCAAATSARLLPVREPMIIVGARLRVGAAGRLLRSSLGELVDRAHPLRDVLGGRAAVAVERALLEAARDDVTAHDHGAWAAPLGAVVRRLVRRAESAEPAREALDPRLRRALRLLDRAAPHDFLDDVESDGAGAVVERVARAVGVSARTLERLFAAYVGVSPRGWLRLRRVNAVAESLERAPLADAPAPSLSDLAHRHGFSDHAHMTREFRRMMGTTPSAYRDEARAAPIGRRTSDAFVERSVPLGTLGEGSAPPAP